MKKSNFWGLAALVAVMGLMLANCGDPNGDPGHTHQWGEWTQTTAPTCEEAGIKTRACILNPSHIDTVTQTGDPPIGHDWHFVERSGTAPTCEDEGEGDAVCSRDPRHTKTGVEIEALGHKYEWEIITHATCSAKGERSGVCSNDPSHTTTEEIPINDDAHDWKPGTNPNDVAATCTTTGSDTMICSHDADHTMSGDVIPALGHEEGDWYTTIHPTCEIRGKKELRCIRFDDCEYVFETEDIPALEHSYLNDTYVYDENSATCTADGTETAPCVRIAECGETHTRAKADTKLSHDFSGWEVTTPPTFTSAGEETEKCSECGELGTQTEEVPQLLPLASIEEVTAYLAAATGGASNDPIPLKLAFNLGIMGTNPSSGWYELYTAINTKGKYVSLDLSGCTMTTAGNAFITGASPTRPAADTPARMITSIILPDTTQSIYSYAFYYCTRLTSVTIPDSVESIDDGAFSNCSSLTSVSIPDSVTSIGMGAFEACTSLTSVDIPDSVTNIGNSAFYRCTGLASVTIGKGVTSIVGSGAFNNCTSLESITVDPDNAYFASQDGILYNKAKTLINHIPAKLSGSVAISDGVTSIGDSAFSGRTGLTSVTIPDSVKTIGDSAFGWCTGLTSVSIGNGVTTIGQSAFSGCTSLTSVTIPDSVKTIGITTGTVDGAFQGCTGLTSVTIGNSVTTIGRSAFSGCYGLTSVTIPDSVTSMGSSAFRDCTSLTNLSINGVTTIAAYAFQNCTSLTSVTIPSGVKTIDNDAFNGCTGLTSVSILNGVTTIGQSAFSGCTGLTSVSIPNSVTYIYQNAFNGCTGLTSITIPFVGSSATATGNNALFGYIFGATAVTSQNSIIPASLKTVVITGGNSIAANAFYGCTSLTSVSIPASVTTISQSAFYNCTGLANITIHATTPPTLGTNAFYNINNCPIYVPSESVTAYRNATNWSYHASRIQAIE